MTTHTPKESIKVIGASGQISLGKEYAGRTVLVEEREPGVWYIRTARVVPDNERWLTPEARARIDKAVQAAENHPARATTPEEFEALVQHWEALP